MSPGRFLLERFNLLYSDLDSYSQIGLSESNYTSLIIGLARDGIQLHDLERTRRWLGDD